MQAHRADGSRLLHMRGALTDHRQLGHPLAAAAAPAARHRGAWPRCVGMLDDGGRWPASAAPPAASGSAASSPARPGCADRHSRASNQRSIGQVVTTIIVAQIVGGHEGPQDPQRGDDQRADDEHAEGGAGQVALGLDIGGAPASIVHERPLRPGPSQPGATSRIGMQRLPREAAMPLSRRHLQAVCAVVQLGPAGRQRRRTDRSGRRGGARCLPGSGGWTACPATRPWRRSRYAGGLPARHALRLPVVTNITPDAAPASGGGAADDFYRAMHDGVNRRGQDMYPVMPYDFYTRITREDSDAIYAYLRTLPAGGQRGGDQPAALPVQPAVVDGGVARAVLHPRAPSSPIRPSRPRGTAVPTW